MPFDIMKNRKGVKVCLILMPAELVSQKLVLSKLSGNLYGMLVYSKDPNSGWVQKNVQGGKSLQIYKCPGWNKNYYIKMSWLI